MVRLPAAGPDYDASLAVARWAHLEEEMALLCRGLANSWCDRLSTVTTYVGLPDGPEYEDAIATVCRRQADAFGLRCAIARRDDQWEVRFSRPMGDEEGPGGDGERSGSAPSRIVLGYLARLYAAARQLHGARLRR